MRKTYEELVEMLVDSELKQLGKVRAFHPTEEAQEEKIQEVFKKIGYETSKQNWTIVCPKHGTQKLVSITDTRSGCAVCYPPKKMKYGITRR